MLYLVGLGLGDVKDITVRGLEIVRSAKRVFLESYTSILPIGRAELEEFYGRSVLEADRQLVESDADVILKGAKEEDVVLLVVGDPFGATTHVDLLLRARELDIEAKIIHNTSIINAIGCSGLQLYNFGEVVSIPYWTDIWKPTSFMGKINQNKELGLHTLCLLDIQIKEPTYESIVKKKKEYLPTRMMKISEACSQLLKSIEDQEMASVSSSLSKYSLCVGAARIGWPDQKIVCGTIAEMANVDMGPPLHSMVIIGELHPLEKSYLIPFCINEI